MWRDGGMRRWSNRRQEIARKMRVNPEWFLVGESDSRGGATCRMGAEGHGGRIHGRTMAPARPGGGQGRGPMVQAERTLRAEGCAEINRPVRATTTKVSASYEKRGFAAEDFVSPSKRLVDE